MLVRRMRDQVLFWAQLGPMTLLLTLLAAAPLVGRLDLPIIAMVGSVACWRWRMRALGGVLATLIGWVAWQLQAIPPEDRFWYLGIGIALALGFVVLCLAFDEVKAAIGQLEGEASSRLETLMRFEGQVKRRETQWQLERDRAAQQLAALEQKLREAQRHHAVQLEGTHEERHRLTERIVALQLQQVTVDQLQQQLQDALSSSAVQQSALREQASRAAQLETELLKRPAHLNEQLQHALSNCQTLEATITRQSARMAQLEAAAPTVDTLEATLHEQRARIAQLESAVPTVDPRLHTLQTTIHEQQVRIAQLEAEPSTSGSEEQLLATLHEQAAHIAQLETELQAVQDSTIQNGSDEQLLATLHEQAAHIAQLETQLQARTVQASQAVNVQNGLEEQRRHLQQLRRQLFQSEGELWLVEQQRFDSSPSELALRHQLLEAVSELQLWEREALLCQQLLDTTLTQP